MKLASVMPTGSGRSGRDREAEVSMGSPWPGKPG